MRKVSGNWYWSAIIGVGLLAASCGSDDQSSGSRTDGGAGVAGVGGEAGSAGSGGDGGDAGSGADGGTGGGTGDGGGSGGGSDLDAGTGGRVEGGLGADSGPTNSDAGPQCPPGVPAGTCSLPFGTPCFYGSTTCVCVNDWVCDGGDAGSDAAGPVVVPEGGLIQQCSGAADCGADVCCAWSVGTQCLPAAGCAVLGGTVIP